MRKETAFSGLEAAIVLIAFVVVAAVFSYVMLGAGFFATQKSQEVTYSGIKQSTSNLVLDGNLYGSSKGTIGSITTLTFYLAIPEGGQAQSMSDVTFMVTRTSGTTGIVYGPAAVAGSSGAITYTGTAATGFVSPLLSPGGKVKLSINMYTTPMGTNYIPAAGDSFSVEVKPKIGAASLISKSLATGYVGGEII